MAKTPVSRGPLLHPMPVSFYDRPALDVSTELLGKYLVRQQGRKKWIGKIVEVEAYIGEDDPACHAYHGLTPRTKVMYGPPGQGYVYFTYGMHFMLNVVAEKEGAPAAILVRALEPVYGFTGEDSRPASGPGKLCKNMHIDKSLNGIAFRSKQLWIGENPAEHEKPEIRWSPRIGITEGGDRLWRAYIYGNPFVSRRSNPDDVKDPEGPFNAKTPGSKAASK